MTSVELADRALPLRRRSGQPLWSATPHRDLTELRLLVELRALRKLAGRGFSDQELAAARQLADATIRSARRGDVLGYLQADMVFHLFLLELTCDPALSEVARLVLARSPAPASRAGETRQLMAAGAGEHCELIKMLTDDRISAADDLLRQHICGRWAGRPAAEYGSPGLDPSAAKGT
jgi:DNA-binding GntR family transcriptional regulator